MSDQNQPDPNARLRTYARIFRQLPRETVAELVVAMATDPELTGRRTEIAQAALGVSAGHRLGWWNRDDTPKEKTT